MFLKYIIVGIEHVIPYGFDHILFIMLIYFNKSNLKDSLKQCTIFTIAHSITLIISIVYSTTFNSKIIEIFISLSIFIVAIGNIYFNKLNNYKSILIFGFGLIHGLGFSKALTEFGISNSDKTSCLFGFNLGIEIAQIIIIAFLFIITHKLIDKIWYNKNIVYTTTLIISIISFYWTIDQIIRY